MSKENFSTPLLDELINYCSRPKMPFHMPGHAGGENIHPKIKSFFGANTFKADLTELDELDNLSNPQGIIQQTQEKIASIFGAQTSYLLINGSTLGLMATILSIAKEGDKILIPRNCHRSIINATVLSGATAVWMMPEWLDEWELYGYISPSMVANKLKKYKNIKAVVITNPTYEGIISDTKEIAKICHDFNVPLIVDEAHGGHFKFNPLFPEDALTLGADASIQSFHKSCGSLSQSSLLHLSKNSLFSTKTIEETLKLLQTTSPSYLLMASLDAASSYLADEEGAQILGQTYQLSLNIRKELKQIDRIKILDFNEGFLIDPTRLFIKIEGLSGDDLADIIESKYHIGIESLNNTGNLFFINIGNTKEQISRLTEALKEIALNEYSKNISKISTPMIPVIKLNSRKAFFSNSESIPVKEAIGKINRYPVVKCPPGVCILVPGEIITEHHLNFFNDDECIDVVTK
ncbi:MAG: aminotransferase class I/II-fold pyridoxal phosphate-dependent enzyme [Vampirovibrionia bacterium]